jgi:hypothetical protein
VSARSNATTYVLFVCCCLASGSADLPRASVATEAEVLHFIDLHALFGRRVRYVDVHLLAAVRLIAGAALRTFDKRLHEVAAQLGLAMTGP